ncbi:transketolase family protein [Aquibacillus halophilus]|uniref:Transketolase family protein n=1 Tax=Aquibacillus halophilus TaxID=930132 RepID=A0A6A8DDD5_9BACI|nr:transketolase C-terminal domain-containing protein [Aquibacillus halophilus]MRH43715.1 transketolase family protein [Aquibacillus halophilus]
MTTTIGKVESMRSVFGKKLAEITQSDSMVVTLDGDLGNSTRLATIEKEVPEAFYQMGIAEQNMICVAAGMASVGLQPWVCSFATFLTKRTYDQLVVSIDQTMANVKLCGAYSGLLTSNTGKTHHSLDDIGLMTMLPNMTVIAPGDANETRAAMEAMYNYNGPVYIRLTRAEDIPNFTTDQSFTIGQGKVLEEGTDVAIITTGSMTYQVIKAVKILKNKGLSLYVLHLPTLKPIDSEAIIKAAKQTNYVFTVEEHYIRGGLGSIVAELLSEEYPTTVIRIGVQNEYSECGKNESLLDKHGLTPEKISGRIISKVYN